ncbi:MAG: hypothetical protein NTW10_03970 [Bacteroidetes bacterium]|nr:hypothetical protein [Bacteroidota bacterium]
MLKKDSVWLGIAIGLICPLILYGIIYLVKIMVGHFALDKAMFVCVALNVVPVRYYFMTAKLERTARGVLAMTVIMIIAVTVIHL